MDDDETEHEPTLDEKRANEELANAAVIEIRRLITQLNIRLGAVIEELEEATDQGVFDGDWIPELEEFETKLVSKIDAQFESI